MPLVSVPLALPADVVDVRVGDVTGDQREDLVFVSRHPASSGPDSVSLTVVSFGDNGAVVARESLELGTRAMFWDIHAGLWGVDAEGVVDLMRGTRVVRRSTILSLLGPTTPVAADIASDLDGDGRAELMVAAGGSVHLYSSDGDALGSVPVSVRGELSSRTREGGTSLIVSSVLPAMVVGDLDGDGTQDLLLPEGDRAVGWVTRDAVGASQRSLSLPLDLADEGSEQERLAQSWFTDLDGDGVLDLAAHHRITGASWFGATARLAVWKGTGSGWQPHQVVSTERSVFEVLLLDMDSDGDQDLVLAEVDVGFGALGRALLARSVPVELTLYTMDSSGRYAFSGQPIRSLSWPLEHPERMLLSMDGDVTGDGWLDLVTNDGGSQIRVYPGGPDGFQQSPLAALEVGLSQRGESLLVHDVTGDGQAEILLWAPGEPNARLLYVR